MSLPFRAKAKSLSPLVALQAYCYFALYFPLLCFAFALWAIVAFALPQMGQQRALPPSVRPKGESVAPLVRCCPEGKATQNKGATYKLPLWYNNNKVVVVPEGGLFIVFVVFFAL